MTSSNAPGWYRDPVDPSVQRYWDGEGWIGTPLPADAPTPTDAPGHAPTDPRGHAPTDVRGHPPAPTDASGGATPTGIQADAPTTPRPAPGAPPTDPAADSSTRPSAGGPKRLVTAPPPGSYPVGAMPVAMPHGIPLASPGARLVARLIDLAAITLLALVANGWFLYQLGHELGPLFAESLSGTPPVVNEETGGRIQSLVTIMSIVTAAVWLAYEVPAVAGTGQTMGKRVLGIKVMRVENTDRLGVGRALRRWVTLGLPTVLWTCCCVGVVLQILDCLYVAIDRRLHQAMHDRSAQTVVVHIGRRTATARSVPRS